MTDILVIDLGAISVHNTFLKAGSEGTISFQRNKLHEEQSADGYEAHSDSDKKSAFSDISTSCSSSYVTCRSGLPMENTSHNARDNSLMTQSTYGSLEQDSRSTVFESWDTFSESGQNDGANSSGMNSAVSSLPSFCSSVGIGFSGSCSVSTAIGDQDHSTPNQLGSSDTSTLGGNKTGLGADTRDMTASFLAENHKCLLDVLSVELTEMDLFSAEWIDKDQYNDEDNKDDLLFPSYVVKREVRVWSF